MADVTNEELKNLITTSFAQLDKRIDHLDKKMEIGFTELRGEIKRVEEKLTGEIKRVEVEIKRVEEKLTSEIKRVEGTLGAKFDGIDTRMKNEEFISRSLVVGVILAFVGVFVRYTLFGKAIS